MPLQMPASELSFKKGENTLKSNAKKLLGYRSKDRRTRIMVTMPSEAAAQFELVTVKITQCLQCFADRDVLQTD